ncbi:HEAT repeat domain-containing protein [Dysgonomonas sp. 520]|uniref:HEAT repeat domain-containing protein n=1 Tax=Dysgonomonas sp. 520 TaxID=2302931 RepID=UPI0013D10A73|nr:HEAT repeat domain-containing protein [Dysgonomonas sp. 520]NDW09751.1 HEAT repeat domain-containing protein [Dysgonomonas sp. 520]
MKLTDKIIVEKLAEVGIIVSSIDDLVNTRMRYPQAIPLLVNLLNCDDYEHLGVKKAIARSLTVKEAKRIANKPLLEEFEKMKSKDLSYCWVIGNAFTVIIQEDDVDHILEIVKDKRNDYSRQMFILALAKIKSRKSDIEDVLIPLLGDNSITGHIITTLGNLKSEKAKSKIELFLNHEKPYYRRNAKNALTKIEKERMKKEG